MKKIFLNKVIVQLYNNRADRLFSPCLRSFVWEQILELFTNSWTLYITTFIFILFYHLLVAFVSDWFLWPTWILFNKFHYCWFICFLIYLYMSFLCAKFELIKLCRGLLSAVRVLRLVSQPFWLPPWPFMNFPSFRQLLDEQNPCINVQGLV